MAQFTTLRSRAAVLPVDDVDNGPVTDPTLQAVAGSFCDRIAVCYGDFFVKSFLGDIAAKHAGQQQRRIGSSPLDRLKTPGQSERLSLLDHERVEAGIAGVTGVARRLA